MTKEKILYNLLRYGGTLSITPQGTITVKHWNTIFELLESALIIHAKDFTISVKFEAIKDFCIWETSYSLSTQLFNLYSVNYDKPEDEADADN